ncbi:MAG: hypothetical protein WBQ95_07680 [Terracidiphilus sp.]
MLSQVSKARPGARDSRRTEAEAIIAVMIRSILCLTILCTGTAYGAVKQIPIKSSVVLKPGETYTATVVSTKPVEIGWTPVQATPCTMDCIQMTLESDLRPPSFSAARGARGNYTPTNGKVVVEYKNVSQQPVTIDVYRLERTCDAEACKLFDNSKKGTWLVFKVGDFKSIANSNDGSYSVISGDVESGRAFRIHVIWWTDQKGGFLGCPRWIKGYVDNHTPKEKYAPYILSGQNVGDENNIVLKSIDTCVPSAPHFGVMEKNVYK